MKTIVISKSNKSNKKYKAEIENGKTIHFGAKGYEDYTTHKNSARKDLYVQRHRGREKWGKDGIETAGYYAKHLLWNKPTLIQSVRDLNKRYKDIKFKLRASGK